MIREPSSAEVMIAVSPKPGKESYCNDVVFSDDGMLTIRGYDGLTILNEAEARHLGAALIAWAGRSSAEKPRDLTVARVDEHGVAYNAAGESIGITGTMGPSCQP